MRKECAEFKISTFFSTTFFHHPMVCWINHLQNTADLGLNISGKTMSSEGSNSPTIENNPASPHYSDFDTSEQITPRILSPQNASSINIPNPVSSCTSLLPISSSQSITSKLFDSTSKFDDNGKSTSWQSFDSTIFSSQSNSSGLSAQYDYFPKSGFQFGSISTGSKFLDTQDDVQMLQLATSILRQSSSSTFFDAPQPQVSADTISSLFANVTTQDFIPCKNCDDTLPVCSRCIDCNLMLCNSCVYLHKNVKQHTIERMFNGVNSPNASVETCSPKSISPLAHLGTCDKHKEHSRLYCRTCFVPICNNCTLPVEAHHAHDYNYIEEVADAAKTLAKTVTDEANTATKLIKDAMDNVQRMKASVDVRAQHIVNEIRQCFRRMTSMLEEREAELLNRVSHTRQYKMRMLDSQTETLSTALGRVTRISTGARHSLTTSTTLELLPQNERAKVEMEQLKSIKCEFIPCEDDTMIFVPPENHVIRAIQSFGNVIVNPTIPPHLCKNPSQIINLARDLKYGPDFLEKALRTRAIFGANAITVKPSPTLSFIFGGEGSVDGKLCRPWGICCDHFGNYIVSDRSNNRVQVFDPKGRFIFKFGKTGSLPGQFNRPAGLTVDIHKNLIVVDKDNHRVQVFKLDGTFIFTFGEKGSRNGQFHYPWDVATNSAGQIVISDTRNHRVQLFSNNGIFICKFGFDIAPQHFKEFDSPRGVAFTPDGNIIITDFNNHRLVVTDGQFGHVQYIGKHGLAPGQYDRPQGIICDDVGNVIIADSKSNRIQVLDSSFNFRFQFGKVPNSKSSTDMDRPSGICLNPNGQVAVVDFGNHLVQVF